MSQLNREKNKEDCLATDPTLAYEVIMVQTSFRYRPAKTQGVADRQPNEEVMRCFGVSCAINFH